MRLTHYANACCAMEAEGFRLLTDPWLVDGAFEGAWHHYPPLKTRPADLAGVDALFVSHVHPDHCDPETLKVFPRDIPILVLDQRPNFLHRVLREMGFTNLVALADGASGRLGPFTATLYAPFTGHLFHESKLGNLIDCAAVFEAGGISVMNFNDNTPDVAAAQRLRARHGRPTVAQLAYNAAGPYPSCFDNLAFQDKVAAGDRILARNFTHAAALGLALQPDWHMPFAGDFVIGGGQWRKNACLGTTTIAAAGAYLAAANPDIPVLMLDEAQSIDLATGERSAPYAGVDLEQQNAYIAERLSAKAYPHEADRPPDLDHLIDRCRAARKKLWARQVGHDFFPDLTVLMATGEDFFSFHLQAQESRMLPAAASVTGPRIEVRMDPKLLNRIVEGRAHWNNAEGGCHIDFVREPDVYIRDFHTMMSFFAA